MTGRRAATAALAVVAALVAAAGGVLVGAAPASAHTHLVRANPADGSAVTNGPTQVVLTFDENVRDPSTIIVTGPAGQRVDKGATQVVDNTATVPVTVERAGTYTISFRVVSADGHPVADQSSFTYRPAVAGGSAAPGSPAAAGTHAHSHRASTGSSGSSGGSGWVIGGVAVVALLGGVALLTGRRRHPGGPGRRGAS